MKRINKMVLAVIMLCVIGYQGSGYSATVGGGGTIKKGDVSDLIDPADPVESEVVTKNNLTPFETLAFAMCCRAMNCNITIDDSYRSASCDCSKNSDGEEAGRDSAYVSEMEDAVVSCFETVK